MKLSLIVAMSNNRVIGLNGQMPWYLSADLKKFKQITWGKPLLMGRKTHESIGKALPGRRNLIISRNPDYQIANCEMFNSLESALANCVACKEVFVIGGATLYEAVLPMADYIYLTQINQYMHGDCYFPNMDFSEWQIVERLDVDDDPQVDFSYSFLQLRRI